MTNRKFYKTTITLEILSENPIADDMELEDIVNETIFGDMSGMHDITLVEVLNGKQMAEALINQDSDPMFFMLTEDGDDDGFYANGG
jgi:hypothetical protein